MDLRSVVWGVWISAAAVACNDAARDPPKPMFSSADIKAMQDLEAFAPKVTGTIHSVAGELGTWDLAMARCQSGERNGFFGVDMYAAGSDTLRLRFVHDEAAGTIVKIAYPSHPSTVRVFDRTDTCAVLEGHVEKTNASTRTTNAAYIRHLAGNVKFDCTYEEDTGGSGHVTGELTFEHCH